MFILLYWGGCRIGISSHNFFTEGRGANIEGHENTYTNTIQIQIVY